jgi:hypothetical protein
MVRDLAINSKLSASLSFNKGNESMGAKTPTCGNDDVMDHMLKPPLAAQAGFPAAATHCS